MAGDQGGSHDMVGGEDDGFLDTLYFIFARGGMGLAVMNNMGQMGLAMAISTNILNVLKAKAQKKKKSTYISFHP